MKFARVLSGQIDGIEPTLVTIETDISKGLNSFSIVGLPDKAIEESKDRISAAIQNIGLKSPKNKNKKTVISLAPADVKKTGPVFDLAIALSYLSASGDVAFDTEKTLIVGELSLDGAVRPIRGALSLAALAKESGGAQIILPLQNAEEAAHIEGIDVIGVTHLSEALVHLSPESMKKFPRFERKTILPLFLSEKDAGEDERDDDVTLVDIAGQEPAKRALEIAAAGGHNVLLFGPPGAGKTLLAKAFSSLLPPLSEGHAREVTAIHSAAGILKTPFMTRAPFRSPHHTSSFASIVGGGQAPQPGEMTLAHRGVLFLDEFPEFDRRVIESLREPLEDRRLVISRSKGVREFPADLILIAAMNPCPCGNYGSEKECRCSAAELVRYKRKLSGPIMDRIDLWIEVGAVNTKDIRAHGEKRHRKDTAAARRIQKARGAQQKRYKKETLNAHLPSRSIARKVSANKEALDTLQDASDSLGLSARGMHTMLKVARTVADLEESKMVTREHILEALQYREKQLFE